MNTELGVSSIVCIRHKSRMAPRCLSWRVRKSEHKSEKHREIIQKMWGPKNRPLRTMVRVGTSELYEQDEEQAIA
jgi:hypothetical protein